MKNGHAFILADRFGEGTANGRNGKNRLPPMPPIPKGGALSQEIPAASQVSQVSRGFKEYRTLVGKAANYFSNYVAFRSDGECLIVAAWSIAARLSDSWRRFPHLAINSPMIRSGKTTLLGLIRDITPHSLLVTNPSSPYVYRKLREGTRIFLFDEASKTSRPDQQGNSYFLELMYSSVDKGTVTGRCGGQGDRLQARGIRAVRPQSVCQEWLVRPRSA
jgi:hypothetical protein